MKKADVETNVTYQVKVAGNLVPVKITREHENGGWEGTSVKTGKTIRIKSPQRLRKRLDDAAPVATKAEKSTKDATDAPERDTGERDATGAKRASGLDAAAQVLADTGEPMSCKTMVERMLTKGLWQTNGKTPAATIYAAITREIATKGDAARFRKVARGKFELTSKT